MRSALVELGDGVYVNLENCLNISVKCLWTFDNLERNPTPRDFVSPPSHACNNVSSRMAKCQRYSARLWQHAELAWVITVDTSDVCNEESLGVGLLGVDPGRASTCPGPNRTDRGEIGPEVDSSECSAPSSCPPLWWYQHFHAPFHRHRAILHPSPRNHDSDVLYFLGEDYAWGPTRSKFAYCGTWASVAQNSVNPLPWTIFP